MSPRLPTHAPVQLAPLGNRIASRRRQVAERPTALHVVEPEEQTPAEPVIAPVDDTPPAAAPEAASQLVGTQPEAPDLPTVGESPATAQAEPVPTPAAKPAQVTRSDQSDGGSTRITFAVPPRCIEKLRRLARQANMTHADVLVTELARLSKTATVQPEPEPATVGEFELTASTPREPLANVGIRLTARNLAAMDSLCERLGLANRSALVAKALA